MTDDYDYTVVDELTIAAYELPPIPTRLHDSVCIVGFADGHRDAAPWDEPHEFWGLNRLHAVLPNKPWTRWFELHSLENFYGESAPNGRDEEHIGFLRGFQGPIYMRPVDLGLAHKWGISHAVPFPIDRILQTYHPYFTNSVSWLLALMIEMQFTQAQIYGVDMAQDSILQAEFAEQRPSCEWLIGMAQGKGIKVVLPPGSDLLKSSHLYGFSEDAHYQKLLARLQELSQRKEGVRGEMNGAQNHANEMQARINQLDGSMQEVQYQIRNLVTPPSVAPPKQT